MNLTRTFLSLTCLLATTGIASATNFTNDLILTLDPTQIQQSGGLSTLFLDLTASQFAGNLSLFAGDSISGTVTFANGPILLQGDPTNAEVLTELNYIERPSFGQEPIMIANSSVSLLGFSGTLPSNDPLTLPFAGGSFLTAGFAEGGSPYAFSFTGFTYEVDVTDLQGFNGLNPATVSASNLQFQAGSITIGAAGNDTPEPASFTLIALGCVALRLIRRRH